AGRGDDARGGERARRGGRMSRKTTNLVQEIIRTVPMPRLIAAVGAISARRQRRAAGLSDNTPVDVEVAGEEFMATCSARQLRLLREIALGLDIEMEGRVH